MIFVNLHSLRIRVIRACCDFFFFKHGRRYTYMCGGVGIHVRIVVVPVGCVLAHL